MDAIKKKMQAMKMEKDTAMDKADTCEGQAKDANLRADKVINFVYTNINKKKKYTYFFYDQVNEDVRDCQKKLSQVESDFDTNKNKLEEAIKQLEDREKALTAVS